jgi:hypothetical protein
MAARTRNLELKMTRKDGFRPSVINPAEFVFVAQHYLGHSEEAWEALCNEMAEEAANLAAHQATHPGFTVAGHKWPGICDCCGARYLYGATFYTAKENTYISIGGICASKMRMGDPAAMKTFREQINTHKLHMEAVAKARAYCAANGISAALDLYMSKDNSTEFPEVTLRDMIGKALRWGNLSDKQIAFAIKLLAQIADRPRLLAEREARDATRQPVPVTDKRLTIVGNIISAKYQEAAWENGFHKPACVKVTVEHADGWKVWGTLPRELWEGARTYGEASWHNGPCTNDGIDIDSSKLKGLMVQFDARVTPSDKDAKFGFFKRPTKALLLEKSA